MKKRITTLIVLMFIIIFVAILTLENNKHSEYELKDEENNVLIALSLDGNKITSFPSKGMYKVNVNCNNADGKWLYDDWKLAIENITGDISCDIDFKTIDKVNFNDYIIGLLDTEQGNGKVLKEVAQNPNYDMVSNLNENDFSSIEMYYNNWSNSKYGTSLEKIYSYENGNWISNSSNMMSGKYNSISFTVKESGFYKICYEVDSGSGTTYFVNDGYELSKVYSTTTSVKSGCVEMGYVKKGYSLGVSQYSQYTSKVTFSIMKVVETNPIDAGIRYEGKNPNNYIWFNNEYWRVIGVLDSNTHGQNGQELVKIIRTESLGYLSFYCTDCSDWSKAWLRSLLNDSYYNAQDGTDSGYCRGYYSNIPKNCNYTKKGIQAYYRKMITKTAWYLGGYPNTGVSSNQIFLLERNNTNSSRPNFVDDYIGLMYVSDYGFSILNEKLDRFKYLNNSDTNWSWLYGMGTDMVTITPHGGFIFAFDTYLTRNNPISGGEIFPTFYLDSSVYVIDGDGSLENPYIIGM